MHELLKDNFKEAIIDYLMLLDKHYPGKSVLRMVATRYGLSGIQRIMLYRGIYKSGEAERRKEKMVENITGYPLFMDGFNVILTIGNYLLGRPLYFGNDNVLRDVGEAYGKIADTGYLQRILGLIFEFLAEKKPSMIVCYIDKPVDGSEVLQMLVKDTSKEYGLKTEVLAYQNPDRQLKQTESGIVLTSDSEIMDKTPVSCFDLPHALLKSRFNAHFIDLNRFAGI